MYYFKNVHFLMHCILKKCVLVPVGLLDSAATFRLFSAP